MFKSHFPFIRH